MYRYLLNIKRTENKICRLTIIDIPQRELGIGHLYKRNHFMLDQNYFFTL